ncbi:hypothetical protein GCM10028833_09710 [Glycomyces tarimensis]
MLSWVNREHLAPTDAVPRAALWILVPAAVATIAALALLWPYHLSEAEDQGFGTEVTGHVISIHETECDPEQTELSEELQADRCGDVLLRLTSGPDAGAEILVDIPAGPGATEVEPGQEVVLIYTPDSVSGQQYHIIDHERSGPLWALAVAFALAVIAFGRWKGVRSLASLGITFGIVLLFIVPAILDGRSPMLVAIVGAAAIMLASLYLSHGWNRTTTVAVLGTLAALVLTGVLAQGAVHLAHLNGVLDEETMSLAMQYPIDMSGLLLAGILIGALGVIDDVTVSQAATVDEVAKANPKWGRARLFRSGMRVGRDHLTSVVNTLVLAYAGASLPLLVLIAAANRPLGQVLTSQIIATEIARTVVGTLGLIAAVPITTWLAAALARREPPKDREPNERRRPRPKPDPEPASDWDAEESPYPPSHLRLELVGGRHEFPRGLVERLEDGHDGRSAGRGGAVDGVDVAAGQRFGDSPHRHVAPLGGGHPRGDGDAEAFRHQREDRVQSFELRDRGPDALGAPQPVQGHARGLAGGRGDPRLLGEGVCRQFAHRRQRVLRRQDGDERIRDQVVVGERADPARAADARPVVDEGQVDLAGADAAEALLDGVLLTQHHRQFGVAAQAADDRAGQGDGDGGEGGDDDTAPRFGGLGGKVGLGGVDRVEDRAGVLDQAASGVGQLRRAGGAFEQGNAGLLLQGGQLLRDRRGGLSGGGGGGGDRPVSGEFVEQSQAADVQHKAILRSATGRDTCIDALAAARLAV